MKIQERILRALTAFFNMVILGETMMTGPWAVAFVTITTYLIFTVVTGECIVREYLLRPLMTSNKQKQ